MGLLAWIGRLWAILWGHPRTRKLSLGELISLLQSEVERGIDAGSRRTADGTVVEVTSVDIEVPLGLTTREDSDTGVQAGGETGGGSGMTTTVDLDPDSGGDDGMLTVRFRPNSGTASKPKRSAGPDEDQRRSGETPLEAVGALESEAIDGLKNADIRSVEDVADAGESAVAEATDAVEGDAKRLVDFATAASLGASHDTARLLAALQLGIDDLASMTPVELLSTIEDGLQSGAASVESTYEADVRELATVVRNAEQAVDRSAEDATDAGSDDDG